MGPLYLYVYRTSLRPGEKKHLLQFNNFTPLSLSSFIFIEKAENVLIVIIWSADHETIS
jgi:hypothetical protein